MLENKYLKYSPEITLEIFTLVWDKLIEYGFRHKTNNELHNEFKWFKDKYNCLVIDDTYFSTYTSLCIENKLEITAQEILGYDPFVKDEFVLPERWHILVTNENKPILNKWKSNQVYNSDLMSNSFKLIEYNGNGSCTSKFPEITFDQFKKYVLKETIETPKEVIPEYVELLKGFDNTRTGKIFDTNQPIPKMSCWSNQWTWESIFKNNIQKPYFKPSTKEDFDAQNKPKSIEKWSPGTYVVCTRDYREYGTCFKVGYVAQIQDGAYKIDEDCVDISKSVKKPCMPFKDWCKWFATKSEAEEFAKTLLNPIEDTIECETCNGEGQVMVGKLYPSGHTEVNETCPDCNGDGFIDKPRQPQKQAVHCKTQEEWDFVSNKIGYKFITKFELGNNDTINPVSKGCGSKSIFEILENYQILSFQEWCDLNGYKMEKEVKFEVGKWYKSTAEKNNRNGETYYGKFLRYDNGKFTATWHSVNNNFTEQEYTFSNGHKWELMTDLSEIDQYLPDGHPDKLPLKTKGIILDDSYIGRLVSFHYYDKFYDEVLVTKEGNKIRLLNNAHSNNDGHKDKSIYKHSLQFLNWDSANTFCKDIKLLEKEGISSREFEVGDWAVLGGDQPYGGYSVGDLIQVEGLTIHTFIAKEKNSNELNSGFSLELNRHATPEEINNHLISIGQIPAGEPLNNGIKPNKDGMFKYTTYAGTTYVGKTSTIPGPLKMTLSIDDEELPMVDIAKTNSIKQLLNND